MSEHLEKKIEDLEIHIAHQAEALETLSETVRQQWKEIDLLTRKLVRLNDRLLEVEQGSTGDIISTRPPHY